MNNKLSGILLTIFLSGMPVWASNYALTGTATQDASIKLVADTDNTDENDNAWMFFSQDNGSVEGYVGFSGNPGSAPDSAVTYTDTLNNAFLIGTKSANPIQLGTQGAAHLTINNNGFVGMGITTPKARLHLAQAVVLGEHISDSTSGMSIRAVKARGTTLNPLFPLDGDYLLSLSGGGYNGTTIFSYNKVMINFRTSEAWSPTGTGTCMSFETTPNGSIIRQQVMYLAQSGNVGIGTDTPTHRLSVNGSIRAKEIIVDTDWSDYVFAPTYHLASLAEVEKHIITKGHLPDVPSAKEVEASGISLGASQAVLLRKIEELTLHLINHEKAIESLRRENAKLRQRLQPLEGDR